MQNKSIRVLNFDNSIIQQSKLLSRYPTKITDFTNLAFSARLYMSGAVRQKIASSLKVNEETNLIILQEIFP